VRPIALYLSLALVAAPGTVVGQSSSSSLSFNTSDSTGSGSGNAVAPVPGPPSTSSAPFSRFGFGVGFSPLGIGLQTATNINDHLNIRGEGNFFNYATSFTTSGFTADANLNLASAGVALDYYPFHKGFRVSPGLLFYNGNKLTATDTVAGGTSFTLNNETFYSANANSATGATPANGNAELALNTTKPSFTLTTGWGNMVPRSGWRVSFPFEIGVAFTGAPTLNANLGGWACHDQAQTECTNLSSNSPIAQEVQSDLQAQIAKWNNDLNVLKTYPILSVGVAYSFNVRSAK
jgi:hypothetical protein